MKRTLIVCSYYPSPENIGTTMRTLSFARYFRRLGEVDIVYSQTLPGGKPGTPLFSSEFCLAHENPNGLIKRIGRWLKILTRPFPIARYERAEEQRLRRIIVEGGYEYIFVRYVINTWSLFRQSPEVRLRTIVDFDDILSGPLTESDISKAQGVFRRLRLRLNRQLLRRYEKKCLRFGAALFCSEIDRGRLLDRKQRPNAFVVPNVYTNPSFEKYDFGDGFLRGHVLLFVGTLNYGPNVEGLRWFITSVFPRLKAMHSDARLIVVGRSPDASVHRLCTEQPGIDLYPDAPDIRDFYRQCRAVVVPLLAGGGTRIKILEAALATRPVIATPMGAEGLELKDGSDILLFRNADEFASRYAALADRTSYRTVVECAREAVTLTYSERAFGASMEKVLRHIDRGRNAGQNKTRSG